LGVQRQFPDLIEEKGASLGRTEEARVGCPAPVKAPRTWPKSCDSNSVSRKVVQSTATKGPACRRLPAWMVRANDLLSAAGFSLDQDGVLSPADCVDSGLELSHAGSGSQHYAFRTTGAARAPHAGTCSLPMLFQLLESELKR